MCPSFTLLALEGYGVKWDTVPEIPNHWTSFTPISRVNLGCLKLSFYSNGLILTLKARVLRCLGSIVWRFRV